MLDKHGPLPQSTFRRYLAPLAAAVTEFHVLNRDLSANWAVLEVIVENAHRAGVPRATLVEILKSYRYDDVVPLPAPSLAAHRQRPLPPSRLLSHTASVIKILGQVVRTKARMDYATNVAYAMVDNARRAGIADYLVYDIIADLNEYAGPNPEWGDLGPGNFPVLATEHAKRVAWRSRQIGARGA